MAQATPSHTAQHFSVQDAAAGIIGLINSSPYSPRTDEIEAIVAKVGTPPPQGDDGSLLEWRQREAAYLAALTGSGDDEGKSLMDDFIAYTKSLWAKPVRAWSDVVLRAEIAKHWNSPHGINERDYPFWVIDEGDECSIDDFALAQLALAVTELGRGPKPPIKLDCFDEALRALAIEGSDAALATAVRTAIVRQDDAEKLSIKLDCEDEAANQACKDRWRELEAIEKQIPMPPRSALHVLLQAEIAYHGADKTRDNRLAGLSSEDCFERPATRLIEAVLRSYGGMAIVHDEPTCKGRAAP